MLWHPKYIVLSLR